MNYWENQKRLKEVYDRATKNSGISWHEEYLKEKTKRIEVEEKYERLTRKIKENALEEVNEREVDFDPYLNSQERIDAYIDFGAGPREIQHIMKDDTYWRDQAEKYKNLAEYYGRLLEMEE